jgi:hypothetical protein
VSRGAIPLRNKKGVNQNQVFPRANRSKQTIGARNRCQFFAMYFLVPVTTKRVGLKYSALRLNLRQASGLQQVPRRPNRGLTRDDDPGRIVVLPTGAAVAYDTARSATDFGALGLAKVHPTMRGSLFQRVGSSTGRRNLSYDIRIMTNSTLSKSDRLN